LLFFKDADSQRLIILDFENVVCKKSNYAIVISIFMTKNTQILFQRKHQKIDTIIDYQLLTTKNIRYPQMNKKSDKLSIPEFGKRNLTSIVKSISTRKYYTYIIQTFFQKKELEKTTTKIAIDNSIFIVLHNIDPCMFGVFFDYFSRRIICEILNDTFEDRRAETVISSRRESTVFYGFPEKIHSRKDCYKKTVDMKNKTENIINELFVVSLSHPEFFGEKINKHKVRKFMDTLVSDETKMKEISASYIEYYSALVAMYWIGEDVMINPYIGDNDVSADCDLVIGNFLVEFKCSFRSSCIYEKLQLLGYACLLKNNKGVFINNISVINPVLGIQETYCIENCENGLDKLYLFLRGK
jgi:hypothetical protein